MDFAAVTISSESRSNPELVFGDPVTSKIVELVETVAGTPSTVMLTGDSGVGKEIFARHVHARSKRSAKPFVAVNCAAIPASLLESELFGHEKGAFSGATSRHIGLFEKAREGTVFLDEVTELPLELQAKLLRVLQERSVRRVGGSETVPLDVRIIAASNRDLQDEVNCGQFRLDLFYRLNVFPIHIPPLRERLGDLEPLVQVFANHFASQHDDPPRVITASAMRCLAEHDFPGNVRELMNVIERAMIICSAHGEPKIEPEHLVIGQGSDTVSREFDREVPDDDSVRFIPGDEPLTDVRMRVIIKTLEHFDGNRTRTAEALGVSLRTVRNKIKQYREKGMDVPEP